MRVGCDLDGVLADLHRSFTGIAAGLFPELDLASLNPADVAASSPDGEDDRSKEGDQSEIPASAGERPLPMTRRQSDEVWRYIAGVENYWESLEEIEAGSVKRLAEIAEAERWEVIFLTSRPRAAGRTLQRQTQLWLTNLGFPMPSVFVVHKSRGQIADALGLDVVIDDRPENCLDVALESKARAILVWRGSAAGVPSSAKRLGIGLVSSFAGCLDLIVEAQKAADTPLDFTQRLRRLLGLQSRSATKA
jgi:hypothetical protein